MTTRPASKTRASIITIDNGVAQPRRDTLATEEPLEIRLLAGGERRTVAVTMRTPGNDFELAAGFLFSEGLLAGRAALGRISYCIDRAVAEEQRYNIVNVALRAARLPDLAALERHFITNSACGVCGKASIDTLRLRGYPELPPGPAVDSSLLFQLPEQLHAAQGLFASTGGLHAAALFNTAGQLLAAREDVGRHNALDKLLGWALLNGHLPLHQHVVLVSGRSSFELVQKCAMAGVPILCAVSAPSSLAVATAQAVGMTLVGFLRGTRLNIYSGATRVVGARVAGSG